MFLLDSIYLGRDMERYLHQVLSKRYQIDLIKGLPGNNAGYSETAKLLYDRRKEWERMYC